MYHFLNVAAVNGWDDESKLKWLKVRLTARAQIAFQRLPEATRESFDEALRERFEPTSRKTRYQAEVQEESRNVGGSRGQSAAAGRQGLPWSRGKGP